jgi:ATP/maltotriose-dependent transcriptional regulator MalT/DNA-binding SARP family transcriptional activator
VHGTLTKGTAKTVPPAKPAAYLERPALTAQIDEVLQRRLTVVAAEAGFAKSTLLASWWETAPCAWYGADTADQDLPSLARGLIAALRLRVPQLPSGLADAVAGAPAGDVDALRQADSFGCQLAEVLGDAVAGDLVLVIDELHELGSTGPSIRLIEALCRHAPRSLHVVLSGRRWPPFPTERLRGQGQLLVLDAGHLAFSRVEVGALLEARLGTRDELLAAELHRRTGGWPAAVVLAAEALRETEPTSWPDVLAGLTEPGAPMFSYLAEEVFAHHDDSVREMVRLVALFPWFDARLCKALGIDQTAEQLDALAREGLLVERRQDGALTLPPLVREFAARHLPIPTEVARGLQRVAVDWFAAQRDPVTALAIASEASDSLRVISVLRDSAEELLGVGATNLIVEVCRRLPSNLRTPDIEQIEGDARQAQGDWSGALACFERAARKFDRLPAGLAWRIGFIHYQRGDLDQALGAYARASNAPSADPGETARLWAWEATAHWVRGDVDACRRAAACAHDLASQCGDRRALAAAHTALAMLAADDGDRRANDAHYLAALRAAEEAGDVLQVVRIRINRASHFTEEGSYGEALQELDVAIPLAELNSLTSYVALGLCNRGEARFHQGRLDEALADHEASRAAYERIGSDMVAYPYCGIGDVHRERGNLAQARLNYREAVSIAERVSDLQGLVPALAGLALAVAAEDPDEAAQLVERALACGTGLGYVESLLAGGWVAAAAGDQARTADLAATAIPIARSRRDRAGLAQGSMLAALANDEPTLRAERLAEALALSEQIGDPVGAAKAELCLASLAPDRRGASGRRRRAERRLESLGIRVHSGHLGAGPVALLQPQGSVRVSIETLGGFSVLRGDQPVTRSEWQSKRARELLKLLIARRGRPIAREMLMEMLWPEEEPSRVANRLSVALSTVRAVLDPDRRGQPDDFVVADGDSVSLNLDQLDVDLERFLGMAAEGLAGATGGSRDRGTAVLEAAAAAYTGDFLEENPYDDWAVAPREQARAAYISVARVLAGYSMERFDADGAVRYLLRVLEIDQYDETANLDLVRALSSAGRHGEAQRHYLAYRRRMDELGVEPVAFPGAPPFPRLSLRAREGGRSTVSGDGSLLGEGMESGRG